MKGLRKFLSPFSPDQSGASAVLFNYGGMLIIMDAGGCAGNVCGFDEPRWTESNTAIFSAGLRDLDAILGRDELLIKKTKKALESFNAKFVGLIGTPVPAVIATDYNALKKLMEKDYGIPVLAVETNGMRLYDEGAEAAYVELFDRFAGEAEVAKAAGEAEPACGSGVACGRKGRIGVIGAIPLDTATRHSGIDMKEALKEKYPNDEIVVYGEGDSLDDVRAAGKARLNIVVSPAGIKAAKMLEERYGVPYEVFYPIKKECSDAFAKKAAEAIKGADALKAAEAAKILVVHQQVLANGIRDILENASPSADVDVATWFMKSPEIERPDDVKLEEEDDILRLVTERGYDVVVGDPLIKRAVPGYKGKFLSLPHFAVSGSLHSSDDDEGFWAKAGDEI